MWIHRSIRGGVVGIALLALGAGGLAAQQAQPRMLTLEDAIDIAMGQNPTVRQAENSARLSTLTSRQQRNIIFPTIRLNTATTTPYLTALGQTDPSVNGSVSGSIQIGNIYSTFAQLEQARLGEQQGVQNLERSLQTVTYDVITSYIAVIETQEQVNVQRENLAAVEAQEVQVEAMVEQGRRPISDLYQQQASTAGAMLSLVQAERALVVARMNLIRLLQLDPYDEYEFTPPDATPALTYASLDYDDLITRARDERADLLSAELQVNSAQQGVRIANANRWPALSLSVGYSSNYNSLNNDPLVDQLDSRRSGSIQLGVSLPLFDPNAGLSRERARIQVDNARIGLENTAQTVETEVRTAYLDLELAEQQLEVAELQLRAAELALQTAQARYEVQAATLVELEQARVAHLRAAQELVSARYSLMQQSRLLEYYIGGLEVTR